jgi:hypothetical protein
MHDFTLIYVIANYQLHNGRSGHRKNLVEAPQIKLFLE